jgi:predicted MFS family arabinose efflux permease
MLNAISLNTVAMNIMRVLGAGLAGLLLIFFNYGQIYLLNAVIFIGVIWTTLKIKTDENTLKPSIEKASRNKTSLLSDFTDGFRYISHKSTLFCLVGLGLLLFVFGLPYQQVYIPLIALDVLDIGRSGAGWMLAFSGAGALAGSLIVASMRQLHKRGLLLMVLLMLLSASLILLAQSRWFSLSALALIMAGGAGTAYLTLSTALLLEQSSMEYHGRVMSLMSLDRGLVSIGAVLAGGLADALGPQWGLTVLAVTCISFTILTFLVVRPLRTIN